MKTTKEINLKDFEAWSGAKDTLTRLIELDKCEVVEQFINECMLDATETEINDFLWFEDDYIAKELLGMTIDEFYEEV